MRNYLMAAMMLPVLASCGEGLSQGDETQSCLTVSIEMEGMQENRTRSSFSWSDTYVHDYEIFLVNADSGTVEDCVFQTGSSAVTMAATVGQSYVLYALVNHGSELMVGDAADLDIMTLDISRDDISSYGIPMSGTCTYAMTSGANTVKIPVTRLLARIDFKVDPSCLVHADEVGGFEVRSVAVCNAMTSYSPFIDDNRQTESTGIDYGFDEASLSDLSTLNSGEKISLYLFENMQGTLLSGNSDPWSKVPSNVSNSERCSYLEVKASYSAQGLSSDDITYRMFLGGDSTSNFDIKRNTIYTVTLIPTEDEIDGSRGSWKVVSRDWDDMRSMIFDPEDITVPSLGSASARVAMDPEPFEVTISHTDWLDAAGCTWSYDQGTQTLTVTNVTALSQGITGYVTATSWDNACDAYLMVYVEPEATPQARLEASSGIDTWGGNSYPLTFTYTDADGTARTVTPTLTGVSYTGGAPSGLITYSGGSIVAADWWGRYGSWVTASPTYTATFSYNGTTTTVSGTMHGFTGFKSAGVYDGYFTRMTASLTMSTATLTGSEDRDLTSSATASLYGTTSDDFSGVYLKTGEYEALVSVVDPSNGKTRTTVTDFFVLTNVMTVNATLRTANFSYYNGTGNNNISMSAGDQGTMYDLTVYTNGSDGTTFSIWFADFQYTDVWGVTHSIGTSLTSPDYGSIPPTSQETWSVMRGDDDNIEYTINGFTFYFHLLGR